MIRVAIRVPSRALRSLLERSLLSHSGFALVPVPAALAGVAPGGSSADVILIDESEWSQAGSRHADGSPALIVLSRTPDSRLRATALERGARGVLSYAERGPALNAAIAAAAAGLFVFGSTGDSGGGSGRETGESHGVTPREREVLALLASGLPNRIIGARLGISEHTVKTYVASILEKLGARTRAEAVAIGHRRGLIML